MFTASIFGGQKVGNRPWRPGKKVWAVSIFGGHELDFRQAQLEESGTSVWMLNFFGGVQVTDRAEE